jgi:hypothetical protein
MAKHARKSRGHYTFHDHHLAAGVVISLAVLIITLTSLSSQTADMQVTGEFAGVPPYASDGGSSAVLMWIFLILLLVPIEWAMRNRSSQ